MSPCSKSRCNQSSACSSPRRSPAYSAVAHTARSQRGSAAIKAAASLALAHAFSTPPKRRQREPQRRIHTDLAAVKRPPVDRPQRKHRIPDSARRTPLPHHPVSEILNLVPRQARRDGRRRTREAPADADPADNCEAQTAYTASPNAYEQAPPSPRPPLLCSLANRQRTRSAHRLPANSRLTLLTPNTRLRQRPKRPPNRLPVPPRPNLRLIRRRTRTPTPHPRGTTPLMPNLDPLMRPPPPHTPSARQSLHHDQHT